MEPVLGRICGAEIGPGGMGQNIGRNMVGGGMVSNQILPSTVSIGNYLLYDPRPQMLSALRPPEGGFIN